jgi:hypothetical protein
MNVEYNAWSVTIYADGDDEVSILKQILEIARKKKISFGSVGIIPLPPQCPGREKGSLVYISLLHCDEKQAKKLLAPHLNYALFCRVDVGD